MEWLVGVGSKKHYTIWKFWSDVKYAKTVDDLVPEFNLNWIMFINRLDNLDEIDELDGLD